MFTSENIDRVQSDRKVLHNFNPEGSLIVHYSLSRRKIAIFFRFIFLIFVFFVVVDCFPRDDVLKIKCRHLAIATEVEHTDTLHA
jgi:hypothetical protein